MIKDRYEYPIDDDTVPAGLGKGLKWEVDFFLKPDGTYFPWVKIDLEVKKRISPLRSGQLDLPPFPFEAEEWILGQTGERSDEDEGKVRMLYDTMFLAKNRYAQIAPNADGNDEDGTVMTPAGAARSAAEATAIAMGARPLHMPEGLGYINSAELHARADASAQPTVPVESAGHFYQAPNPAKQGSVVASFGAHFTAPAVQYDNPQ
jgi:hypothetical protein